MHGTRYHHPHHNVGNNAALYYVVLCTRSGKSKYGVAHEHQLDRGGDKGVTLCSHRAF
jgi:hypothetical protein